MVRSCTLCREKAKLRCDKCRNEFCADHAIKCHSCGTISCIRDLARRTRCPVCGENLRICPECLLDGNIVRTLEGLNQCPVCGWVRQS